MSRSRKLALAALAAVGLALGACVSLLPKTEPAQLYRFGYGSEPPAPGARSVGPRTSVLLDNVTLTRAAVGDQILTVAGDQAAYLSGARWDAPASLLFTEAVQQAFDERAQRVRLQPRGGLGKTTASLRLYVRDLEADYGKIMLPPPTAKKRGRSTPPNLPPPTAVVAVRARLTDAAGQLIAERDFVSRRPAAENRVGAIVPALDGAVEEVLNQLVAWADASAPAPSAPMTPANGR